MAGLTVITLCALAAAAIMAWRMRRLKKDIYDFADNLETNLDRLISGKKMENAAETEDTLRGKINEKLQRAGHILERKERESLEEKKRMKELISDISHQTKTPIANQKVYLELLFGEPMSEKAKGFLESLGSQTDKLDFLLQSLVKMSRLDTGIILIQSEKGDLVQTLLKAVAAIVPAASQKQIELFADCGESVILPHDRKWTEEAVFNLLDNAVKYTAPGGKIEITAAKQEIFTVVSIQDTGKGIEAERQAQIFTRFYREPEVHDKDGIGIGLYLARKIIELQNGYIEVHSEPGLGSDFRIYLPNEVAGRHNHSSVIITD